MRVTIHQPDLLPYSGFWYKMVNVDRFVLAVHDQFQKHGYQRRVTMRGTWCSHQLVGKPSLVPINEVSVADGWQQRLSDAVRGRYSGARHFDTRGRQLLDGIQQARGTRLDEVNTALIHVVRQMLGIDTELITTAPPAARGIDRLIEQVRYAGGSSYLSGAGGAAYLGDDALEAFAAQGIALEWSRHEPVTGDSIVTVLMDEDDPMMAIRRAHPDQLG